MKTQDIRIKLDDDIVVALNAKVEATKASGSPSTRNVLIRNALVAYLGLSETSVESTAQTSTQNDFVIM